MDVKNNSPFLLNFMGLPSDSTVPEIILSSIFRNNSTFHFAVRLAGLIYKIMHLICKITVGVTAMVGS